MRVEVVVVVEEATMERLVQVYHQELHNKKWKILLEGQIFFEEIPQTFLQITLGNKILKLLLKKTEKDFKIGELKKKKKNFQTFRKELLIRENRALILIFQIHCRILLFEVLLHQMIFHVILNRLHSFLNRLNHEKQVFYFLMEINLKVYRP